MVQILMLNDFQLVGAWGAYRWHKIFLTYKNYSVNPFTVTTHVGCSHTLIKVVLSFKKNCMLYLKSYLITLTSEIGMAAILVWLVNVKHTYADINECMHLSVQNLK
jgi:hypothetical protein